MKTTFNQFIAEENIGKFLIQLDEENILGILTALRKRVVSRLQEDVIMSSERIAKYLKIIAMFEQLFRFISVKKIDPNDISGFKPLVVKNDLDTINDSVLDAAVEKIIKVYDEHRWINFKTIVEKRAKDFREWFFGKNREDLEIVKKAIDYTTDMIYNYQRNYKAR